MSTINDKEIDQFNNHAQQWWNESGPFKPLHQINPTRIKFIKNEICSYFNIDALIQYPFKDLSIIDVGCGGGLVTEPMARLAATVTGLDGGAENIEVAQAHALAQNLTITYVKDTLENYVQNHYNFDVCLALEVIEHVDNVGEFIQACAASVKSKGIVIFSTLNRTFKSLALGIGMAEYVLQWVPRGTHTWSQFLKPDEIIRIGRKFNLQPQILKGLTFNPFFQTWQLSDDTAVNYFLTFTKS